MAEPNTTAGNDVARPGETPATATSKPIIIGKGPAIKDPMVHEADQAISPAAPLAAPSAAKKTISPISAPSTASDSSQDVEEVIIADETSADIDLSAKDVNPAAVDSVQEAASKEDAELDALSHKLIASGTYFVPIGAVHRRRTHAVVTTSIIVLVVVAMAVLAAIDAELLPVDVKLPFDLIK